MIGFLTISLFFHVETTQSYTIFYADHPSRYTSGSAQQPTANVRIKFEPLDAGEPSGRSQETRNSKRTKLEQNLVINVKDNLALLQLKKEDYRQEADLAVTLEII